LASSSLFRSSLESAQIHVSLRGRRARLPIPFSSRYRPSFSSFYLTILSSVLGGFFHPLPFSHSEANIPLFRYIWCSSLLSVGFLRQTLWVSPWSTLLRYFCEAFGFTYPASDEVGYSVSSLRVKFLLSILFSSSCSASSGRRIGPASPLHSYTS